MTWITSCTMAFLLDSTCCGVSSAKKKRQQQRNTIKVFDATKYEMSSKEDVKEALRKVPDLRLRKEVVEEKDFTFYEPPSRKAHHSLLASLSPTPRREKFAFGNPLPMSLYSKLDALDPSDVVDSNKTVGHNEKDVTFCMRLIEMEKLKLKTVCSDKRRRQSITQFRKTMPCQSRRTSFESCDDNESTSGNNHHHHHHRQAADKTEFSYDSFARLPPHGNDATAEITKMIENVLKLHSHKPRKPRSFYLPRRRLGGAAISTRKPQKRIQEGAAGAGTSAVTSAASAKTRASVTDNDSTSNSLNERQDSASRSPSAKPTKIPKDAMELLASDANRRISIVTAPSIGKSSEVMPRKHSAKTITAIDMQNVVSKHNTRKRSKSVKRRPAVLNVSY